MYNNIFFIKTFLETYSPHLYASFGTFCAEIGQLLKISDSEVCYASDGLFWLNLYALVFWLHIRLKNSLRCIPKQFSPHNNVCSICRNQFMAGQGTVLSIKLYCGKSGKSSKYRKSHIIESKFIFRNHFGNFLSFFLTRCSKYSQNHAIFLAPCFRKSLSLKSHGLKVGISFAKVSKGCRND